MPCGLVICDPRLTPPESEGRPVQSHLEQIVRRTHAIYATLHEHGIDATPSWTGDAKGAGVSSD